MEGQQDAHISGLDNWMDEDSSYYNGGRTALVGQMPSVWGKCLEARSGYDQ